ncbi:MAG: substrate-binding domain-containing protein [Bryobacterales bacterium]
MCPTFDRSWPPQDRLHHGSDVSVSRDRQAGYEEALRGRASNPAGIRGAGRLRLAERRTRHEEASGPADRPTAVCCVNDPSAMGAIRSCREARLEAPRDISITGVGAIEFDYAPEPFMTTTLISRLEFDERRRHAAHADRRRKPDPMVQRIEPELVIRRSTAPPRARR